MSTIKIENLTFSYYGYVKPVFENVSFSFDTNWKTGLIGRNGVGKSTLFKLLLNQEVYKGKISKSVDKENRSLAMTTLMFALFSVLNGAVLSAIFVVFDSVAIIKTFFITAGTFGVTAAFGYFTKRDLSTIGSMCYMALFGLIIASLANFFFKSVMFDYVVSYIGVAVFIGITAWDSQKIKHQLAAAPDLSENSQKLALVGALDLYLDFVNLFLYLLRIFNRR